MEPKSKEQIITTKQFGRMRDKYLAEKLVRTWSEDFIDEESGEVVSIERSELIYEKGTFLDQDVLTSINFHMQTEGIEKVKISNQKRTGTLVKRTSSVWEVTAVYGLNKKYKIFMYSNSMENTKEIAEDYLEQIISGAFSIIGIKELSMSTLIPCTFGVLEDEEIDEIDYYSMEVSIVDEDFERKETYIVKAKDAEAAKVKILMWLDESRKKMSENAEQYHEIVTILTAKTISCDFVVDYEFSLAYIKDENES